MAVRSKYQVARRVLCKAEVYLYIDGCLLIGSLSIEAEHRPLKKYLQGLKHQCDAHRLLDNDWGAPFVLCLVCK